MSTELILCLKNLNILLILNVLPYHDKVYYDEDINWKFHPK